MKFDLSKIVGIANAISSPKEAMGMALNMLSKKNPDMASKLSQMIKSGADPSKAIEQFASEGSIKADDLTKMKNIYAMAKKAGFKKFDVPTSVWDKAEKALKNNKPTNGGNSNNWF